MVCIILFGEELEYKSPDEVIESIDGSNDNG